MKPDLKALRKVGIVVEEGVRKHAPTILSATAVLGLGITVIFTVKAVPRATEILEERDKKLKEVKEKEKEESNPKEQKKDLVKVHAETAIELAPVVAPAVTSAVFTIACIVGADRINVSRLAAASVGYDILKDSFNRYKKANETVVGEKQAREVEIASAQSKVTDASLAEEYMISTGLGNTIYFDCLTGRYFRCSKTAIENAVNIVNSGINNFMFVSLNEFYYNLRIPGVKMGDEWGWNGVPLYVTYSYTETPSGEHAIAIDYDISLRHRFGDE